MALKRSHIAEVQPELPVQPPHSLPELKAQLASSEAELRRAAILELSKHPDSTALLTAHLKDEPSAIVRETIFTALARLGDATAIASLADCLRTEDANLRNGAIEALKLLPEQTARIIPKLLADQNSDVRILTISILESLRHPKVESWLIEVLEKDPHLNVCGSALDLMVEVGSEMSKKAIEGIKLRFPNEPYIQFTADLALKRINKA
jgi:HEAT repeat protein